MNDLRKIWREAPQGDIAPGLVFTLLSAVAFFGLGVLISAF